MLVVVVVAPVCDLSSLHNNHLGYAN